jgi:hypothetical protein
VLRYARSLDERLCYMPTTDPSPQTVLSFAVQSAITRMDDIGFKYSGGDGSKHVIKAPTARIPSSGPSEYYAACADHIVTRETGGPFGGEAKVGVSQHS